jgi:hypothetical protein
MVYAVLQYYKAYTKSSLAQMQHDFDYANPNLYGAKPLFLEISSIPANQMNIDYDLNQKIHGKECLISKPDSKIAVYVIPTNEELVIARDTCRLLGL